VDYANGVIAGFVDTDGVTSETRYCVTDHQGSVEKIVNDEGKIRIRKLNLRLRFF